MRILRAAGRPRLALAAALCALPLAGGAELAGPRLDDLTETPPAAVPQRVPALRHVVVVVFENKDAGDVVGSSGAPVFNGLLRRGAALTDYNGVAHPSLPNYLALVSGSTHGITSDCTSCSVDGPSLGTTLPARAWKTYAEGIPARGWTGAYSGRYAKKHVPLVYFRTIQRSRTLLRRVVPLADFRRDLRRRVVPRFALVVPDLCHDTHDCGVGTGDRWLRGFARPLLASSAFAGGVLFVVYDESESRGASNRVPALAIGPAVRPGSVFRRRTDHYGLLRTIEQGLGLPLLGRSRDAQEIVGIWREPPAEQARAAG